MPRIARIVAIGYPHHIVQRGNSRQTIFFDENDKVKYLYLLKKYSSECNCAIHTYCLMDNHVHMLAVPKTDISLAKTMQKLSLTYTQYVNQKYNRTGRLWECRYYSALVDKDNYLLAVSKYIEQNPVRVRIVSNAVEYPWSSAQANIGVNKTSFIRPICDEYDIDKKEYIRLLKLDCNEDEVSLIRKSTMSGKPIGSSSFIENIFDTLGIKFTLRSKGRPRKNER